MPVTALDAALELFRAKLGISTPSALRKAFYERDDLVREACTFCEQQDVGSSGARIVSRLAGFGRHGFHHLEPNLGHVFQADMPTLADMVEKEAIRTHAIHAAGPHGFGLASLPDYLQHQGGHFSLEAVECRNGEWRYWHLTTLRQHLIDSLTARILRQANQCIPMTRHRAARPGKKVELQGVAITASEDEVARELNTFAQRLTVAIIDELLADPEAIPGRVGMSPPKPDDYGTPDDPAGTWTLALVHPEDAGRIACEDLETSAVSLGAFPLGEWESAVVEREVQKAEAAILDELARLRRLMARLQGPPEPHRMIIPEGYEHLFED